MSDLSYADALAEIARLHAEVEHLKAVAHDAQQAAADHAVTIMERDAARAEANAANAILRHRPRDLDARFPVFAQIIRTHLIKVDSALRGGEPNPSDNRAGEAGSGSSPC